MHPHYASKHVRHCNWANHCNSALNSGCFTVTPFADAFFASWNAFWASNSFLESVSRPSANYIWYSRYMYHIELSRIRLMIALFPVLPGKPQLWKPRTLLRVSHTASEPNFLFLLLLYDDFGLANCRSSF
jgi:hypothetical protein